MRSKKEMRNRRQRRKRGIRNKIFGTPERPRLSVYRSNEHIYVQIIDDLEGHTLTSASSLEDGVDNEQEKLEQAEEVGKLVAERAQENDIDKVVFDRNGFIYHGRVEAIAEGARQAGLQF
jgi:large subunit ribosomal protein L18